VLRQCADAACPAVIQADCTKWLTELEQSVPTIVIVARSEQGDETDVNVFLDGRPWIHHLDGKPVELDPGAHQLRFEHASRPPLENAGGDRTGREEPRRGGRFLAQTAGYRACASNAARVAGPGRRSAILRPVPGPSICWVGSRRWRSPRLSGQAFLPDSTVIEPRRAVRHFCPTRGLAISVARPCSPISLGPPRWSRPGPRWCCTGLGRSVSAHSAKTQSLASALPRCRTAESRNAPSARALP